MGHGAVCSGWLASGVVRYGRVGCGTAGLRSGMVRAERPVGSGEIGPGLQRSAKAGRGSVGLGFDWGVLWHGALRFSQLWLGFGWVGLGSKDIKIKSL